MLGSTTAAAGVGDGFVLDGVAFGGFAGVAVGLIRGSGVDGSGVADGGGVGGVTGRASPKFGVTGRLTGVGVIRLAVACGGGTSRPLAVGEGFAVLEVTAGVFAAVGVGVGGVDGRLSLSIRGALACALALSGAESANTMSKTAGRTGEKFFKVQLICATVLSSGDVVPAATIGCISRHCR